ncbi:methyltransferase-like protein [Euroglyphus maynei]|uniref:Methyltransferase-like protein n=1 Tax=Euroglyphus maynei TaxID=6958 RepID=A0A1Y3BDP7_EURMA|nr:methyltransferase-like protein [Euroglyphus maynei]
MEFDPSKYSKTSFDSLGPATKLIRIIQKQNIDVNQPLRIVDLGCGPGNSTQLLTESFPRSTIIGLDVAPEMIEHAQKNYSNERCNFYVQDLNVPFDEWKSTIRDLFRTKTVDIIFSNYALQWIFDPFILGDSIRRILTPKTGLLVANILYSDILSVVDPNDQRECSMLEQYLRFPNEQQFISNWIFGLKNRAHLNDIWIHYWQPRSVYPERYYNECM